MRLRALSNTPAGGGGLSESAPFPTEMTDAPDAPPVVNVTHVCKSIEQCWCEKKSITRFPEHPALRETREEISPEGILMFPALDVRAAAKEAMGLGEAKKLLLGEATAARL